MSTNVRITVEEFDRMIERGAFGPPSNRRWELIDGEVREMTPPNPPHEDVVDLLTSWSFASTSRDEVRVRIQNSLGIPQLGSVPMPDVSWVREKSYRTARPQVSDVLLLIEVSDTTLRYDRTTKAPLYAQANVKEYWIVNLPDRQIEVHRRPQSGQYTNVQIIEEGQSVSPLAVPSAVLKVSDLFVPPGS